MLFFATYYKGLNYMKKIKLAAVIALCSMSTVSFAATLHSMDKNHVMKAFEDKTMTTIQTITMNQALVPNTISVYLAKDGSLSGKLANKPDNDPQTDAGKWVVKSDGKLCATWQHWNQGKETCVMAYNMKNGVLFINTNNSFETFVLADSIKSGNQIS